MYGRIYASLGLNKLILSEYYCMTHYLSLTISESCVLFSYIFQGRFTRTVHERHYRSQLTVTDKGESGLKATKSLNENEVWTVRKIHQMIWTNALCAILSDVLLFFFCLLDSLVNHAFENVHRSLEEPSTHKNVFSIYVLIIWLVDTGWYLVRSQYSHILQWRQGRAKQDDPHC